MVKQSEMVERVARAMLLAEHPTAGVRVWEVDPEAGRVWLARARAAIEATGWQRAMQAALDSLVDDNDSCSAILILKTALK